MMRDDDAFLEACEGYDRMTAPPSERWRIECVDGSVMSIETHFVNGTWHAWPAVHPARWVGGMGRGDSEDSARLDLLRVTQQFIPARLLAPGQKTRGEAAASQPQGD